MLSIEFRTLILIYKSGFFNCQKQTVKNSCLSPASHFHKVPCFQFTYEQ